MLPSAPDQIPNWIAAQLLRAGADRRSALRWPVLVTGPSSTGGAGRVVVLRHFETKPHRAIIYTDTRSAKVEDLTANPNAELVFFDPKRMLQIRLRGTARLHLEGSKRDGVFNALSDRGRLDYSTTTPPGSELPRDGPERDVARARDHFAVIEIESETYDVLSLARDGHRRVKTKKEDGMWQASWVNP